MKINLNYKQFEEIVKKGYSLDMVFILNLIKEDFDINSILENSMKIQAIYQTILRKGLITEDNKISVLGKELLKFLEEETSLKLPKKKKELSGFTKWWETYPGTDTFTYNNKKFKGSRGLRINKSKCEIAFNKILNEGEYTSDILILALELDIAKKAEESFKSNSNKFTYMQNSLTYLNQKSFEPFIELLNSGETLKKEPLLGSTDI